MILPEHESNRLLTDAGVPRIAMRVVNSREEAIESADRTGYPVVLKLSSSLYTHKTEVGGVVLHLKNEEDVESAFEKLEFLRNRLDPLASIILEPMAPAGAEFFVGYQRHPQFGPVISLGLGGVSLELLQDVAFRLLPAGVGDFSEMLAELKTWPKLNKGFRNLPPVDESLILTLLQSASCCVLSHPEIEELDLNPVIVHARGATVVDARIVTGSTQS